MRDNSKKLIFFYLIKNLTIFNGQLTIILNEITRYLRDLFKFLTYVKILLFS